jgi:hypothetical protein
MRGRAKEVGGGERREEGRLGEGRGNKGRRVERGEGTSGEGRGEERRRKEESRGES